MSENSAEGRILVVEDDVSLRTILRIQLERAGYDVRAAQDGEEALRMVAEDMPDLILLDVMMPGMNGYEVCHALKSDVTTANIPVIMLTARSEQEDRIRGLSGGANDYLTKPYEVEELLVRVRNILQWSQLQRAANPLTGLPGNIAIEKELRARLGGTRPFAFLYVDLDNAQAVAQEIVREFDAKAPKLYAPEDRERGYIQTHDRSGQAMSFPLMTVTIAGISVQPGENVHIGEISQKAAELKHLGKQNVGSIVVWERRAA